MADTFVKNPMVVVGTKDQVVAEMGANDFGVATDVSFYTAEETDAKLADKQDIATAINYDNISNCITEIPQDIKLEIGSSNQLIVKAGSKVYYGDGSSATLPSDKSYDASTGFGSEPFIFCIKKSDLSVVQARLDNTSSNATNPGVVYRAWFNTTDGKCYMNDGSGVATETSFPIGIVQHTNNVGWTNIDQVFNGSGCVGATIFALPGVEGLISNRRNSDGSLKSNILSITKVFTYTVSSTNIKEIRISNSGLFGYQGYIISDTKPSNNFYMWYNPIENILYDTGAGTPSQLNATVFASVEYNGTRITSFTPKTAFHAVDYNDTHFIARQAMPSGRYIDLSTGINSGYSYTAPADGYLTINKGGSAGDWLYMRNTATGLNTGVQYAGSYNGRLFIPVQKGHTIQVQFQGSGTINEFRFIYANGAK